MSLGMRGAESTLDEFRSMVVREQNRDELRQIIYSLTDELLKTNTKLDALEAWSARANQAIGQYRVALDAAKKRAQPLPVPPSVVRLEPGAIAVNLTLEPPKTRDKEITVKRAADGTSTATIHEKDTESFGSQRKSAIGFRGGS